VTAALSQNLTLGAVLFALGAVGFLVRRNLIVMFLCVELMLMGVAVNLAAFARYHNNLQGQAFVVFMLTVAACESAIALALVVALYTKRGTLDAAACNKLNERADPLEVYDAQPPWEEIDRPPAEEPSPTLTPAGLPPRPDEAVRRSRRRPAETAGESARA
jgi:NADH-quinone oxidoreductase subunit K